VMIDFLAAEPTVLHTLLALKNEPGRAFTYVDSRGDEETSTFAEIAAQADAVARTLRRHGFQRGDRIALFLPDAAEFVPFFLGAVRLGLIPVPMAAPVSLERLDAWRESAARILSTAGARGLLCKTALVEAALAIRSDVPSLRQVHDVATLELESDGGLPDA